MPKQPLAEIFGFPIENTSKEATRYRDNALCPFGNKVPNCTKDKAKDPLGVCSIFDNGNIVITCPIRFREKWLIAEDAASFLFKPAEKWTTLTEVRLKDKNGGSAGNIDVVLCSYDTKGIVTDFGALEIQAVYISGNIRDPFKHFMESPSERQEMDWSREPNYPHPDYLSSSRKRLAPQLMFKGGILKAWGKKSVVALNRGFFDTLPILNEVEKDKADIAWFVYDLVENKSLQTFTLEKHKIIYTKFSESLAKITQSEPGDVTDFMQVLQGKIDEKMENNAPPDTEVLDVPF